MKTIFRNILTMFAVALAMVACKDAQPEFDDTLLTNESTARETLTAAEAGYFVDEADSSSMYKITLTLLSEGVTIKNEFNADEHCESFAGYGGTGYAFELELNSESKNAIASGVYVADTVSKAFTFNPENSYLTVLHNGNSTKQVLSLDTKISISASEGVYTVTIDGKNAINVPVKGKYEGAIDFYNLKYYREPETAKSIKIDVANVVHVHETLDRQGSFNFITITGTNGEIVSLRLAGNTPLFISKKYTLEEGVYETDKSTREDRKTIYSFLSMNNNIYYLSGSIDVKTESTTDKVRPLKSFKLKAKSAYGSTLNIEYTMPVTDTAPTEPEVKTAVVKGEITSGDIKIAGATVKATSTDGTSSYTATSATDGQYSIKIEDLTKSYKIVVSAEGYENWTYANESVTFMAGQELVVDAELNAVVPVTTAKVWGIITAGDPLAGATVTVTSTDGSATYSATSATDGKYSVIVEDLTKTYKLVVSADGYESWTYTDPANGFNEEFILSAGQELAISANLNAVSTTVLIMGEVVDSETKEAIEAELTVSIADAGMPDDIIDELPTDAGMFEFEVETEMVYVITISDSAGVYETHSFEVEVGDADVELDPVELTKKATE